MIFSREYSRAILNLREGDGRFSQGGKGIFGRAVVEVRGGKGRIMVFAQGVKGGCICSLYIICRKGRGFVPLKAVLVNTKNSRAEVKWDFNPDNILGSGFKLEDVGALAVMTDRGDRVVTAFFDRPFDWGVVRTAELESQSDEVQKNEETAEIEETADIAEGIEGENEKPLTAEECGGDEKSETIEKNGEGTGFDFTEVVNRFRKDVDELRRFAYIQKMDFEDAKKDKERDRRGLCLEGILEDRETFELEGTQGRFCRIFLDELCLVDPHMYKFENNPTFRRCFNKYGHLILGSDGEGLVLGLPDEEREFKDGEILGFCDFVLTKPQFGYRIMKIEKH